ncbi:type I polyketide synthase [Streptomyces sp. NPDC047315]|uniref:type I polyketide synthase n=1 Tax=Streptomyces sp. NPDC047315 TaxID=3155142 RepID=UPI0033FA0A6D
MSDKEAKLLGYLKKVTADLQTAQRRLRQLETGDTEPLAVVGMACRLPGGVSSPEGLWNLISSETDAITEFPTNRGWRLDRLYHPDPEHPGTSYTREGGFLPDADQFDPGLFGISPREALAMDPQQRLLLETSWEAFERAAVPVDTLRGTSTGVFVGAVGQTYTSLLDDSQAGTQGFALTGGAASILSGRLSYVFGFEGPAITIDTACSSSLVALHLAVQSLRRGECSLALVGGVTVMATPSAFVEFSRQRGLAADGRCKAFSDSADGTGWAEGVGVLLVERLSDAVRNGRRVLAVVRGSAVNQDGASNGLTAPNGPSQREVIRAALRDARLSAGEVDVVEAHGTGTKLGDPIEAQALLSTYGQGRADGEPLWLGSLKSNIGHTQAAAGVAGVMKMVLALQEGVLPRTLHADVASSHVDWASGAVELLTEAREWAREEGRPRRAGVSSFGMSGTNAHVIVEEAPAEGAVASESGGSGVLPVPLVLSAASRSALADVAGGLGEFVGSGSGCGLVGLAGGLVSGRSVLDRRGVVVAGSVEEAVSGFKQIADGGVGEGVVVGGARAVGGVGFVFPGQGAQWVGMGRGLLDSSSVFAEAIEACEGVFSPLVDWSLREVLMGEGADAGLDRVDVVQPVSFAVMVALARLWRVHGVEPSGVVGHSQGEIAAVCVAGGLSLADAARVVVARSKAIRQLSGRGAMASLRLSRRAAEEVVAKVAAGEVWVAAENGPNSVVVSGSPDGIANVIAHCTETGVSARKIAVDYASHSPHIDEVVDEVRAALAGIEARKSSLTVFSSVTGEPMATGTLDVDYWIRNLREPVEFHTAVTAMLGEGFTHFVEVSAHPVLVPAVEGIFDHATDSTDGGPVVWGSLRRDHGDRRQWCTALAQAFTNGLAVDWSPLLPGATAIPDLPTYPFQRQRYWVEPKHDAPELAAPRQGGPERMFWQAVEDGDVDRLLSILELPGQEGRDVLTTLTPPLSRSLRRWQEQQELDQRRYGIDWQLLVPEPPTANRLSGTWLLVVPEGREGSAAPYEQALTAAGAAVRLLPVDTHGTDSADLAELVALLAGGAEPAGVLSLLALADEPHPAHPAVPAGAAATLLLIQTMVRSGVAAPLWGCTYEAVPVNEGGSVAHPAQAQIWGLGRVTALEHPKLWGGLVDVPRQPSDREVRRLVAALHDERGEDQFVVRPSGTHVRRLVRRPLADTAPVRNWKPGGRAALVTGDPAGLGGHVARWLSDLGGTSVVLLDPTPAAPDPELDPLRLGADIRIVPCDLTAPEPVAALLAELRADGLRIGAFLHTADAIVLRRVDEVDLAEYADAIVHKATAAEHVMAALDTADLEAAVFFTSIAGVWGSGDHASYAAAHAHTDALARHHRARGLPVASLALGRWHDPDPTADAAAPDLWSAPHGLPPLPVDAVLTALHHTLDHDDRFVAVADVDWERFASLFTIARPSRLLDGVPEARQSHAAAAETDADRAGTAGGQDLRDRLTAASKGDRRTLLLETVRTAVAGVLSYPDPDAIEPDQAFNDLGFDSVTAVELRNHILKTAGVKLPMTVVFDHPNCAALAEVLGVELGLDAAVNAEAVHADLDRLAGTLDRARAEDVELSSVKRRLRSLLSGWSDPAAEEPTESEGVTQRLEDATDDELLAFINKEF